MRNSLVLFCLLATSSLFAQEKWPLEKCIEQALQNNLQIKQSRINADIAHISVKESKMGILPNLNAQAIHGYNWGQTIDPFTNQFASNRVRNNSFGVSSSVNLFSGFQRWNTIKQAKFDYLASIEDAKASENQILLSVANGYLQILLADEFQRIAQNQLEQSQKQLKRVTNLVEVGQLAKSSLLDMKTQVANDESNLIARENDLNLAYLQLFQFLQLEEGESFEVEEPNLDVFKYKLIKETPNQLYEIALAEMPEIAAADFRLKSAEAQLALARSAYSPRLTLSGSIGTGYSGANKIPEGDPVIGIDTVGYTAVSNDAVLVPSFSYNDFVTKDFQAQLEDNRNQTISFSLTIPIFNGNSARYGVKRSKLNNMRSQLQYEQSKNQLRQDIERAYMDALSSLKAYEAGKSALTAAKELFDYAQVRFDEGVINNVEYSDARTKHINAQADLARSKYNFIFKVKVLEYYKGENLTLD